MKLAVLTPERMVLDDPAVDAVYALSTDGEVGILPRHIPLVASLSAGVMRVVRQGKTEHIAVMGGLLTTDGQRVSILTPAAECAAEIDMVRATQARERAEARLKQKQADLDTDRAGAALTRSMVRLKATRSSLH
jgi:F-type H+-transporting ATPase subunit epsilon